jgi:serine/threonine protein kinase
MPEPGETLNGRYRLDDLIAIGGMGQVWRATDILLGRPVAVKMLLVERSGDPSFQQRFEHEARAMAALRHPGVAAVHDYGATGDGSYLVMARIDGEPLDRRIAELGRLSPDATMTLVAQVAAALQAVHRAGIVHRDVTPGNLIIEPDGNVVLVDFGVARSALSVTLTGARNVIGTANYMAPEQVAKQTVGPPADLYALGAVAYHCLAGRPPFGGGDAVSIALRHVTDEPPPLPADVPGPIRALVTRALSKDPADRHPSATAMASAAASALEPVPRSALKILILLVAALAGAAAFVLVTDPLDWLREVPATTIPASSEASPAPSPASIPTPRSTISGTATRKNPPPANPRPTRPRSSPPSSASPGESPSAGPVESDGGSGDPSPAAARVGG